MRERLVSMGFDGTKGMWQRGYSDALIIPLRIDYHSLGPLAIDGAMGAKAWEERFGQQADHVDAVSNLLGYSLWELHALYTKQTFRAPCSTG